MFCLVRVLVLLSTLVFASATQATIRDTEAKTRSSPVVATPEAAKAQLYSGGLGYAYKIDLPPAAGIMPELQLSYSSLTQSTEYGRGWSLNLSKIERSTRKGPPEYSAPGDDVDQFELDGSLLVKGPQENRFYLEQIDHRRILYVLVDSDGKQDYWEITDPDGTKYFYGYRTGDVNPSNSKLDEDDVTNNIAGNTFRWSLDKVMDPRGNYYEIDYVYETFLHPQPSGPALTYNMNNYPKSIRYSYHDESEGRLKRVVEFQWEGRGNAQSGPGGRVEDDWNDDRPTSYRSGFKIQISKRLANILVGTDHTPNGEIDSSERIRRYEFRYLEKPHDADPSTLTNPPYSVLATIQRYGKTDQDVFPSATEFEYTPELRGYLTDESGDPTPEVVWGNAGGFIEGWSYTITQDPYEGDDIWYETFERTRLIDMNGDGFTDLLHVEGPAVPDCNPYDPNDPNAPSCTTADWWVSYGPVADGEVFDGHNTVWGFGAAERWKCHAGNSEINDCALHISSTGAWGTLSDLFDIDGDGLPDLVSVEYNLGVWTWSVARNLGDAACSDNGQAVGCFADPVAWTPPLSNVPNVQPWIQFSDPYESGLHAEFLIASVMADVNGDGLPDHVSGLTGDGSEFAVGNPPDRNYVWVSINNGQDGFFPSELVPLFDSSPGNDHGNFVSKRTTPGPAVAYDTFEMFTNIDGDGMADRWGRVTCLREPTHTSSLGRGWQTPTQTGQAYGDEPSWDPLVQFCSSVALAPERSEPTRAPGGWVPGGSDLSFSVTTGTVIDINGDGIDDIFRSPWVAEGLNTVYLGLGDGTYLTLNADQTPYWPPGINWESRDFPFPFNPLGRSRISSSYPNDAAESGYFIQSRYPNQGVQVSDNWVMIDTIDMNGDGLLDRFRDPWDSQEGDTYVDLHPGPGGLLRKVTNELGGEFTFEYTPSTWIAGRDPVAHPDSTSEGEGGYETNLPDGLRQSAVQWVLTNITVKDGRTLWPQSQEIDYSTLLYDYDRREYIGARMAESTDAYGTLTRSFFHQIYGLRPRLEFEEVITDSSYRIRTDKTVWAAAPAVNEFGTRIDDAWFPKPTQTISTIYAGLPVSTIIERQFDDKTGNLTRETDCGPDETCDTPDDFVKIILQFPAPNITNWLISYPLAVAEGTGGPAEVYYYDEKDLLVPPTQGLVTQRVTSQLRASVHGTDSAITEQWHYDEFGNQEQYIDGRAFGSATITRRTVYDSVYDAFPVEITNALGHVTKFDFNFDFGEVTKVFDPNRQLNCWNYDTFGRLIEIAYRNGSSLFSQSCDRTTSNFEFVNFDNSSVPKEIHILETKFPSVGSAGIRSRTFIDGLGRNYRTEKEREEGGDFETTVRSWDDRGLLTCESLPFLGAGNADYSCSYESNAPNSPVAILTNHDELGRPLGTSRRGSGGSVPEIGRSYSNMDLDSNGTREIVETQTTYANQDSLTSPNRVIKIGRDQHGRVVAVDERPSDGGLTRLQRDWRGRVVSVDGPIANDTLAISYNDQNQRLSLSGWWGANKWEYEYDKNGNLTKQISPASKEIRFHWDELDRIGVKDYGPDYTDINTPNFNQDVVYTYDNAASNGIGRLNAVYNPGYVALDTSFTYWSNGNIHHKTRTFGGSDAFHFTYIYDWLNRRTTAVLPNGDRIRSTYDGSVLKKIESLRTGPDVTVADNIELHDSGQIVNIDYSQLSDQADGVDYTYNPNTYRLLTAEGRAHGAMIQNLFLSFDSAGNLRSVKQGMGGVEDHIFTYDNLHRIKTAGGASTAYSATGALSYDYDVAGNMTIKGPLTLRYQSPNGGPHAVSTVEEGGSVVGSFDYDDQGGVTKRITSNASQDIYRDEDGRVFAVISGLGNGTGYHYDESGERIRKVNIWGGGDTLYVDREYEVDLPASGAPEHRVHYFYGSRRIATENRTRAGLPDDEGETVSWQYYFPDYVGSNGVVAMKDLEDLEDTKYSYFRPFGEFEQPEGGLGEYLFTDQENDPESGLMYYGARYYDPWVGRFLSQDPDLVGPFAGLSFWLGVTDPRHFNSYSYALNAPTVYTDPTGRLSCVRFTCASKTPIVGVRMGQQAWSAGDGANAQTDTSDSDSDSNGSAGDLATGTESNLSSQGGSIMLAQAAGGGGRGDPHGDAGRTQEKIKERLDSLRQDLRDLEQNQGSRSQKQKIRTKIRNLERDALRMRKGETHWRRGPSGGKVRSLWLVPWDAFMEGLDAFFEYRYQRKPSTDLERCYAEGRCA